MNGFTYVLFLVGLWYGLRTLLRHWDKADVSNWRDEEIERTRRVLERDPTNSGTRAKMAGFLIEDGDLEAGIHEYRTAIGSSPHGPFTTEWKRKLRDALVIQEKLARGERIPGFNEWRVCEKCQAKMSAKEKNCPRCGVVISKGLLEWGLDKQTQSEIWREALPFAAVLIAAVLIFSSLTIEWKAAIACSTAMVMGYVFLRSIDG